MNINVPYSPHGKRPTPAPRANRSESTPRIIRQHKVVPTFHSGLHLAAAGDASIYFFPTNPMPVYKVKYKYWYVEGKNAADAKTKAINTIIRNASKLIDVEKPKKPERKSLLRLLILGK